MKSEEKIKIAVSSCLLGSQVRYDGNHKANDYILNTLDPFFEFVSICPEVGIGMGVPRPPIRLVSFGKSIRAVGIENPSMDVTEPLVAYIDKVTKPLNTVSGYILKKGSPSCGMERVKLFEKSGQRAGSTQGLFAGELMKRFPLLPVEEEGRLNDAHLRENFIERVFVYARWQKLNARKLTAKALIEFHSQHKFLVMAHSQAAYKRLGVLLANLKGANMDRIAAEYIHELMAALKRRATRKNHVNVLQHIAGYLKKHLDAIDKASLGDALDRYRNGEVPLIVPVTLINYFFRKYPHDYIQRQVYLEPHPAELMLRNHV